jgi:hypothetical protein
VVSYSKVVEELKDELLSVLGVLQTIETTGPSMYEVIAPVAIVLRCKNYKCLPASVFCSSCLSGLFFSVMYYRHVPF